MGGMRPALTFAILSLGALCAAPVPADLILHNGKVWTVDQARPVAQAVAVRGSEIVKIGSDAAVLALKGNHTRVIDLKGRLVLPGFDDAHTHFENAVQWFFEALAMDVTDETALLKRVHEATERVPKGMWITGTDWSALAAWSAEKKKQPYHPFAPHLALLDAVTPDHPVLLRRYDRVYFANSRALQLARVTEHTPDPLGGRYEKDAATGKLTGILTGTAGELMEKMLPPFTKAEKLVGARGVMREFNERGITSIHDIARLDEISQGQIFQTFTERSYSDVSLFRDLESKGGLSVRVYAFMPLQVWSELDAHGIHPGSGDDLIRYGVLKDFTDGSLMFEPFENHPGNAGSWVFRFPGEEQMQRNILAADRAGYDIGIHVLGDRALHAVLDWYETAIKQNGPRDRRFRLIHAWYATADDLERAGRLHLIADVTPGQLTEDPEAVERAIGPERSKTAFAWNTMLRNGVKLDIVSDMPGLYNKQEVASFDPLANMYSAITRKKPHGSAAAWHPEQSITLPEAIEAYTANPAFASHEEKHKGTITEGKLADLVVLSKDILAGPPEELLSTRVVYTILGGKIVFESKP